MASTRITRTLSANGDKKLTISAWIKRGNISVAQYICRVFSDGNNQGGLYFTSGDNIEWFDYVGGAYKLRYITNAVYRDTGAWMHILAHFDNSLGSPEAKLYVNGVEQSLSTSTNYTQNQTTSWNNNYTFDIGSAATGTYFDGSMTHFYFIQNQKYAPTTFGETDSTSGIWKPITSPTIDYSATGSNSCLLKFENSANLDLDSGDNNLTFTTSGTLTQNVDTPSNNYATFNPLVGYSNGNYVGTSRANTRAGINFGTTSTTLIPNKGKWFIEYHFQNASSNTDAGVGGWSINTSQVYGYGSAGFKGIVWKYAGNVYVDGTNNVVASDTYTNGDIISIAINYDDDLITFYKNGSTATNLINYSYSFSNYSDFSTGILDGASSSTYDENFDLNAGQNPTFGGRKTAGTYADANGHGLFSMAVPSGYYAINTKNIKEFG